MSMNLHQHLVDQLLSSGEVRMKIEGDLTSAADRQKSRLRLRTIFRDRGMKVALRTEGEYVIATPEGTDKAVMSSITTMESALSYAQTGLDRLRSVLVLLKRQYAATQTHQIDQSGSLRFTGRTYQYRFWVNGKRYVGATHTGDREEAMKRMLDKKAEVIANLLNPGTPLNTNL